MLTMRIVARAADLPASDPDEAADLAEAELTALLDLLYRLAPGDWIRPTACARWTVHDVVAHVLGQVEEAVHPGKTLLRIVRGRHRHPELDRLDARNECQVDDYRGLPGPVLVDRLARFRQRLAPAIRRRPRLLGVVRVPAPSRRLRPGYLDDAVFPRELWMHRADVAAATGRPFVVDGHDRRIIEQAVRDLGRSWTGPPVVLRLTGTVDAAWLLGHGDPVGTVHVDAVRYLRALAGRERRPGLRVEGDDRLRSLATAARIPF
ncbi:hypothetical protein C3Y87_00875 [Carbonactinospora thermoautotrophica]|nr:hypothetical protein [Carbonactinospora thermoautotrophica]